jgi:hypothetical protein
LKIVLLYFFLVYASFTAVAQENNSWRTTHPRTRGVYANFNDFQRDSPSIREPFVSDSILILKEDSDVVEASLRLEKNNLRIQHVFGFCDGIDDYIQYSIDNINILKVQFWKVGYKGRYSYFTYTNRRSKKAWKVVARIILYDFRSVSAVEFESFLMVITDKGLAVLPDRHNMERLLSKYPDLLKQFREAWEPFSKYDYPTDDPEPEENKLPKNEVVK